MDKKAIEKFAVRARRELMDCVARRAARFGVTEDPQTHVPGLASVGGTVFSSVEAAQRDALVARIREKGFTQVVEEVAYTWFNRFCALRFMEVNAYLPSRVRVFSNAANEFKPQVLAEALALPLPQETRARLLELKQQGAPDEDVFKLLLIWQCNDLGSCLPGMFERIGDYTELLFPDHVLREGSVLAHLVADIPEEDWREAVQIIGWLYQYYNTEPKAAVFAGLKKNVKITKDTIPAATQLFTPDWIVRYMVENSLGRLWLDAHPDSALQAQWKYFLPEAEQEPRVQAALQERRAALSSLRPEQLSCIDPCMGSGHVLAYMFDVLMQIYASQGYRERDAVAAIVQHNLHGLDIDDRAGQLAYFAVMMKARQYDHRWLSRGIQPRVFAIQESNFLTDNLIDSLAEGDMALAADLCTLQREMHDAKEYGSILSTTPIDAEGLVARLADRAPDSFPALVHSANLLSRQYDVVVTNPPYMGGGGMDAKLAKFVKRQYPDSKTDLFAVFIERCHAFNARRGYAALITMHAWMFLSSFAKLRLTILERCMVNMAHLGCRAFDEIGGEVVQTTTFITSPFHQARYHGIYHRLVDGCSESEKEQDFLAGRKSNIVTQEDFSKIPGSPIAYWVSGSLMRCFSQPKIADYGVCNNGFTTGDNDKFLRLWHEVASTGINLTSRTLEESVQSHAKWFPYNKGGSFRKWYGNNEYIINWLDDGRDIKEYGHLVPRSLKFQFRESITWSKVASGPASFREKGTGTMFDVAGLSLFVDERQYRNYLLGLLNSACARKMLEVISPTLNCETGHVSIIPVIGCAEHIHIDPTVRQCVDLCRADWDSFETSWDFKRHPLLMGVDLVQKAYFSWEDETRRRFELLKGNEEELNRIFIGIYGLQDELTPEVEDRDVTVRLADRGRDIRSLISYAVGCMFGRYSLDEEGLAYAGGEWHPERYKTFPADADNIIPITDDEYFGDDIVKRFCSFIGTAYGAATLEENLHYIAESLGKKGKTARDVLREYFLKDFYADHCKVYQKRPIYWLFDSGKKNGFKALVYIHRYDRDTLARMRTDYVHRQQDRYHAAISRLEKEESAAEGSVKVRKTAELQTRRAQLEEISAYEEILQHFADRHMSLDLDDGVKHNYELFPGLLAKIK